MITDPYAPGWDAMLWGEASVVGGSRCRIYVNAVAPNGNQSWLKPTIAHELFHCIQFNYGHVSGPDWIAESTAVWAEDVMNDEVLDTHSDHQYANSFFSPASFEERTYDAGIPLIMLRDLGATTLGYDMIQTADPRATMMGIGGFDDLWHQTSVNTWNWDPVDMWSNDGEIAGASSIPDAASELLPDETASDSFLASASFVRCVSLHGERVGKDGEDHHALDLEPEGLGHSFWRQQ